MGNEFAAVDEGVNKTSPPSIHDKSSPLSTGKQDCKSHDVASFQNEKVLDSVSMMPIMQLQNLQSDHFEIIKNKLKRNTPAVQVLPTAKRNPREVGNLFIIVLLSVISCGSILYFISPLAMTQLQPQSSSPLPLSSPLAVYFVVSGSVPVPSTMIMSSYSKYIDAKDMADVSNEDSTPKTDHLIRFQNIDPESLKQITRALLADDLMKIGVASAKIRATATVTLLCSSLFISEYCGQTWSAAGCPIGVIGASCNECLPGRYGATCQLCPVTCSPNGVCDGIRGVGKCICQSGWAGPSCNQASPTT